ncbi:hypothetical protein L9F63_020742, partial [Diploptera punctata]
PQIAQTTYKSTKMKQGKILYIITILDLNRKKKKSYTKNPTSVDNLFQERFMSIFYHIYPTINRKQSVSNYCRIFITHLILFFASEGPWGSRSTQYVTVL